MNQEDDSNAVIGSAAIGPSSVGTNKKSPPSSNPSDLSTTKSFGTVASDTNYYESVYKMTSTPLGSYHNLITTLNNNTNTTDASSSSQSSKAAKQFKKTSFTPSPPSSSSNQTNNSSSIKSQVEEAIIKSTSPIQTYETEEINVLGQKGLWLNKGEIEEWLAKNQNQNVKLSDYKLNNDPNPEIIHKKSSARLEYTQDFTLRLLKPTTPEPPGDIIIKEEASVRVPAAPPLIIRQYPNVPRVKTPEPLVIRERPPEAPPVLGKKLITISGKRLPPPPRKVIIERLAQLPAKPQSVLVERWLPFPRQKRKVIYQRPPNDGLFEANSFAKQTKNTIVEWSPAEVDIKKRFKFAGVTRVDPEAYVQHYGAGSLMRESEMPRVAHEIKPPEHYVLASHLNNYNINSGIELEGDIEALKLIDLDKEGLAEYKYLISANKKNITFYKNNHRDKISNSPPSVISSNVTSHDNTSNVISTQNQLSKSSSNETNPLSSLATELSSAVTSLTNEALDELIFEIFSAIDVTNTGKIELTEAQKTLMRLNSCLDKKMEQSDLEILFKKYFNRTNDGMVSFPAFRAAFLNISI